MSSQPMSPPPSPPHHPPTIQPTPHPPDTTLDQRLRVSRLTWLRQGRRQRRRRRPRRSARRHGLRGLRRLASRQLRRRLPHQPPTARLKADDIKRAAHRAALCPSRVRACAPQSPHARDREPSRWTRERAGGGRGRRTRERAGPLAACTCAEWRMHVQESGGEESGGEERRSVEEERRAVVGRRMLTTCARGARRRRCAHDGTLLTAAAAARSDARETRTHPTAHARRSRAQHALASWMVPQRTGFDSVISDVTLKELRF